MWRALLSRICPSNGILPKILPSRDKIALRLLSAGLTVRFCSSPGRIFMSREGGFVLGGWFWRIYCLVMCLHLTFSPSKDLEDTEI